MGRFYTIHVSILVLLALSGCAQGRNLLGKVVAPLGIHIAPGEADLDGDTAPAASPVKTERIPLEHPDVIHSDSGVLSDDLEEGQSGDFISANQIDRLRIHNGAINALAVSADGKTAYTASDDGRVVQSTLVDWVFGKQPRRAKGADRFIQAEILFASDRPVLSLALSHDERLLAISQFSLVTVIDLATRRVRAELTQVKGRITALEWDPHNELLALGLASGEIFVWDHREEKGNGRDSYDAVERYPGGSSPITAIIFHPSGRSFFSAEREGRVAMWRLVRTEEQLGLRDDFAVLDQVREGSKSLQVTDLAVRVEDIWLDPEGAKLFAAASDGAIYRWKVRGLVGEERIAAGREVLSSVTGTTLPIPADKGRSTAQTEARLLATVGRDQRLRVWCQAKLPDAVAKQALPETAPVFETPVAESEKLVEAPNLVRAGSHATRLWAGVKTGNLLSFDLGVLLNQPTWRDRLARCS